jgi:aspartyl-tRNA(Asn)/glutamyl-tRNA(Gln) amidotransferase subunit C
MAWRRLAVMRNADNETLPDTDSGLSSETVEHVARLARLGLQPEEVTRLRDQLRNILSAIDVLNRADTSQVPATAHPLEDRNVMRDDVRQPCLPQEAALRNAPRRENGFFKVKAIQE